MTVLLLWTVALFLQATRRKDARLLAGAAALAGCAVTVKPSAAIFWMALVGIFIARDEMLKGRRPAVLLAASAPFLLAPSIALGMLYRYHALHPF